MVLALFLTSVSSLSGRQVRRDIFGWTERVLIGESRLEMEAKLDTGADTSSLHATSIRRYRNKSGQKWVEFVVRDKDTGRTVRYKKRLIRYAYIKEHGRASQRRPVVMIDICLGDHNQEIEVNLVDRSGFDFPVLLGRTALQGVAVVDPESTFTTSPKCSVGDAE